MSNFPVRPAPGRPFMRPGPGAPVGPPPVAPVELAPLIWLYRGAVPPGLCGHLIARFDRDPRVRRMAPYPGTAFKIDHGGVDSLVLSAAPGWEDADAAARRALEVVLEHHYYDAMVLPRDELAWADNGINMLRYEAGEGRCSVHYDYGPGRITSTIAYLNDVTGGGETFFPLQGVSVRPEAGAVLVFPPHYAFRHGVRPTPTRRYVLTCWLHRDLEREPVKVDAPPVVGASG